MEVLFDAIKSKDIQQIQKVLNKDNINHQDNQGRTPLIYAITQHAPTEVFDILLQYGANLYLADKLGQTVLTKAIKFNRIEIIQKLLNMNIELNHPDGIVYTPWFQARNKPQIADLLLDTKGAIRLTLTLKEQTVLDKLIYSVKIRSKDFDKLNSPELIHSFVLNFNWDDDVIVIKQLVESENFKEITAIEVFELVDGAHWLTFEREITNFEQGYIDLVKNILDKFPQIKKYESLYDFDIPFGGLDALLDIPIEKRRAFLNKQN